MPITPLQTPATTLVFTSSRRRATLASRSDDPSLDRRRPHPLLQDTGGQRRFSRDQLEDFVTSMQNAGEIHDPPAAKVA